MIRLQLFTFAYKWANCAISLLKWALKSTAVSSDGYDMKPVLIIWRSDLTRSAGWKSSGDLSVDVAALQKDEAVTSPDKPILL